MKLFQWLKELFWPHKAECYQGIDDLPQYYWIEIHKNFDLSLLIKGEEKKSNPDYLIQVWNQIYDEYISEIGLDPKFIERLKRKAKLAAMRYEYIITKKKHLRTLIKLEEELLKEDNKEIDFDFRESVAHMRKFMGITIDSKTISVAQYNENLKMMAKYVK